MTTAPTDDRYAANAIPPMSTAFAATPVTPRRPWRSTTPPVPPGGRAPSVGSGAGSTRTWTESDRTVRRRPPRAPGPAGSEMGQDVVGEAEERLVGQRRDHQVVEVH